MSYVWPKEVHGPDRFITFDRYLAKVPDNNRRFLITVDFRGKIEWLLVRCELILRSWHRR